MRQYHDLLRLVLEEGKPRRDRTGVGTISVFGAQARFAAQSVQIRGTSNVFVRIGDSGGKITYHFCPTCGATVHYALEREPQLVAIPVGAFADSEFPPPGRSLYEQRMHSWVGLPSNVEHIG